MSSVPKTREERERTATGRAQSDVSDAEAETFDPAWVTTAPFVLAPSEWVEALQAGD